MLCYMYTACLVFYLLYYLLLPNFDISCTYRCSWYRFCDSELPVGPHGIYGSLSLHLRMGMGPGFGMYSFLNIRWWTHRGNLIIPTTLKTPYTISLLLLQSIKLFISLFRLFYPVQTKISSLAFKSNVTFTKYWWIKGATVSACANILFSLKEV